MDVKKIILGNKFVDDLRIKNDFNQLEFDALKSGLVVLKKEWHGRKVVDKEVLADLFTINDALHGYLAICENINDKFSLKDKVYDAWCEINELINECLNS